jgi:hypothetical protein
LPLLPIALVAPELGNVADALKGQVERRPPKLLDELAGVRFVARGRQLVVNRQAHHQGRVGQRQLTVERLRARIHQKEGDYPQYDCFPKCLHYSGLSPLDMFVQRYSVAPLSGKRHREPVCTGMASDAVPPVHCILAG